jgi:hypothetical protein
MAVSGDKLATGAMRQSFRLDANEALLCFIAVGTPEKLRGLRGEPDLVRRLRRWMPGTGRCCRGGSPIIRYVYISRHMESELAILALAALAQSTRLETFRLLVKHEPDGVPAGEIARHLGVPHNTMSSHLTVLSRGARAL